MILARTLKGKGVSFVEGRDGWHGKPLKGDDLDRALAELEEQLGEETVNPVIPAPPRRAAASTALAPLDAVRPPEYELGSAVATREAYGAALAALGAADSHVVVLDADVKNSTFSDTFERQYPDRFYQMFIAEQAMVGAALGLASRGAVPFPSTFACFSDPCRRLHPDGWHRQRQRQARRVARGGVDRRGRSVADGARGSRHDARCARVRGALPV